MQNKTDIEFIHKIDDVNVSTPLDLDSDLADMKVKGENKGVVYYAVPKDSRLERISDWFFDTIAGKNKEGKGIGKIKDVISWVFPKTKPLDWITDEIGDFIKSKRTNDAMKKNNPIKDVLQRAFTKDGGGLFRVRDKDGNISLISITAVIIRLALLTGFLYLLNKIGVPIEQGLHAIGL